VGGSEASPVIGASLANTDDVTLTIGGARWPAPHKDLLDAFPDLGAPHAVRV
jgi:hypothetical protein